MGPGGDISTPTRPDKLESAFLRQTIDSQPNQIDYPLRLEISMENYSRIALKSLTSFPSLIFYDSSYPLGKIYPWPIPLPSIYEVHIQVKDILSQFTSIDQDVVLPEEYEPAIVFNLAVRLSFAYGQQPAPALIALAKDALNVLRETNVQVSNLTMPADLVRVGIYNPYSDQVR